MEAGVKDQNQSSQCYRHGDLWCRFVTNINMVMKTSVALRAHPGQQSRTFFARCNLLFSITLKLPLSAIGESPYERSSGIAIREVVGNCHTRGRRELPSERSSGIAMREVVANCHTRGRRELPYERSSGYTDRVETLCLQS
ncbi:uncharacterized protein [Ptychodera flava]|uniref:uncharacterized protein n=1 Tax=Ptychodera flava TaxID=63121 RepID=UPI00396A82A7